MICPKGHGSMVLYEDGAFKQRYLCATCDLKLDFDTATQKTVVVVGAIAGATALSLAVFNIFFGGRGGDDSGSS
jgi:uncharacterized protein (DUF983 family)